jgi:hypothetical protein
MLAKKFKFVTVLLCVSILAVLLFACVVPNGNGNENDGLNFDKVYAFAQEAGYTGTLEELIEAFKGESAYEIAVRNGYAGSEADWIATLAGASGRDGNDGITPHIGNNGNWFFGETDSGILARSYFYSGEYTLWGMNVKVDITQDPQSNYVNAESGFYTEMTGFDLTKCRIIVARDELIFRYIDLQNSLVFELIFEREYSDDFHPYFSYLGYNIELDGEDVKNATNLEWPIQRSVIDARQLDTVLSLGETTIQIVLSQRYFSCYLIITDENQSLLFFAELLGMLIK